MYSICATQKPAVQSSLTLQLIINAELSVQNSSHSTNEKQKVNEDEDKKSSSIFYLSHPCPSFYWIDNEICSRWKGLAKTIMTIPKFKTVWWKT
jgi:hypothetical protein